MVLHRNNVLCSIKLNVFYLLQINNFRLLSEFRGLMGIVPRNRQIGIVERLRLTLQTYLNVTSVSKVISISRI